MDELEVTESVINEWKEEKERNEATIKKAKEDEEIIRRKLKDTSKELETLNTCMVFQNAAKFGPSEISTRLEIVNVFFYSRLDYQV